MYADDVAETQPGGLAEAREELAVELDCSPEPLGDGDNDLPVGNFLRDLVADELSELLDLLLMAAGAEVALLAAEGVECTCNFQTETAFPFLEPGAVLLVKRLSMGRQALPKRRRARTPWAVKGSRHSRRKSNAAAYCQ